MERTAILVLGHGSRRARANAEFEALVGGFRRRRPDLDVGHAYIELAEPLLADGLARLAARAERVIVLPFFLFAASHLKEDVPHALGAARSAFPRVRFQAARPLGVHRAIVAIALDHVRSALRPHEPGGAVLLAVGRGASDADANGDFCKMVRLVGEAGGFDRAEPSFMAITAPRLEAAAERLALADPERVVVLPYFLFDGLLVEQLSDEVRRFAERHPGIDVRVARHLGGDDRVLALLEERLDEVVSSGASLPCEACPRSAAA
ncbi:MAG TPA: sirohydrochlorin chelatase [Anaeromyxobacter sp.]